MTQKPTCTRDEADAQLNRLRDARTASASKKIDAARIKATANKAAKLTSARLAKAEEDARAI